jgi:hypothetical protein
VGGGIESLASLEILHWSGECIIIVGNFVLKAELNESFCPIGTFQEAQELIPPKAREIIQEGTFEVKRHWEIVFISAHSRQEP